MTAIDTERVGAIMRRVAELEAMPRWRNLHAGEIIDKDGSGDLVTVADKAVEAALSAELAELLPGSSVVGEEAVHANPRLIERLREPGPAWVIDPIDGTHAFASGQPEFAVMVALVADGLTQAGWILTPANGELIFCRRGDGVWRSANGAPVRLSRPTPPQVPADMRGITGRRNMPPDRLRRYAEAKRKFRSLEVASCAGLEYAKLARGEADFALFSKSEPWDHLPGLVILAELGFHCARHDGSPYTPGDNSGGLLIAPDRESWRRLFAMLLADG
jgi:fructose-1,6-bisphosphatase/inositol monophosphatase family enzyme